MKKKTAKNGMLWVGTWLTIASLGLAALYFAREALEKRQQIASLKKEFNRLEGEMAQVESTLNQVYALSYNLSALTQVAGEHDHNLNTASDKAIFRAVKRNPENNAFLELLNGNTKADFSLLNRMTDLRDKSRVLERKLRGLTNVISHREELLASIPSIVPAKGWISSSFGPRLSPFNGELVSHNGIDIAAKKGARVRAAAGGEVIFAGDSGSFGRTVVIDHGFGLISRYAHNSRLAVTKGDQVGRGDVIAVVGSTGRSTGPHLHYEVLINGNHVDPKNFLMDIPTDVIPLTAEQERPANKTAMGGDSLGEESAAVYRSEHPLVYPIKLAIYSVLLAMVCLVIPPFLQEKKVRRLQKNAM